MISIDMYRLVNTKKTQNQQIVNQNQQILPQKGKFQMNTKLLSYHTIVSLVIKVLPVGLGYGDTTRNVK